jgi:hypothetical protein
MAVAVESGEEERQPSQYPSVCIDSASRPDKNSIPLATFDAKESFSENPS